MRLTVSVASTVCSVERTRCPVSAAESAIWAVSESRISDQDDVRVLPQDAPQRSREGSVGADLTLIYDALVVAMEVLDRVLDRDDVLGLGVVDEV